MRANMSATGSVNLIVSFSSYHSFAPRPTENLQRRASYFVVGRGPWSQRPSLTTDDRRLSYQDDFETPGISPRSANPRKQSRQMPNLRR
jgi:hypothetical protein